MRIGPRVNALKQHCKTLASLLERAGQKLAYLGRALDLCDYLESGDPERPLRLERLNNPCPDRSETLQWRSIGRRLNIGDERAPDFFTPIPNRLNHRRVEQRFHRAVMIADSRQTNA